MIKNSAGKVYYGMHFYPGVAEYKDGPDQEPYRVFINEDTIRAMSPSFVGCPVFVEHVDEVEQDIDLLRNESDGWVIESFFNPADGKTWAKFIIVSERGERAIQKGFRLSNAYIPKAKGPGGLWNGVTYKNEITDGEFEHLAIVPNPRYEESKILTPDEFKEYNRSREIELKRLANSKDPKEQTSMKLSFFKRAKVENSADLEGTSVVLPKSKKEVTIEKLVNDADEMAMNDGKEMMANGDHKVMVGESKMSVNELLEAHKKMNEELKSMKEKNAGGEGEESDVESMDNEEEDDKKKVPVENEEDDAKKADDEKKKKENEEDDAKKADDEKKKNAADKKAKAKENFEKLKNAHLEAEEEEVASVDLMDDQIARGKSRYGSA